MNKCDSILSDDGSDRRRIVDVSSRKHFFLQGIIQQLKVLKCKTIILLTNVNYTVAHYYRKNSRLALSNASCDRKYNVLLFLLYYFTIGGPEKAEYKKLESQGRLRNKEEWNRLLGQAKTRQGLQRHGC